MKKRDFLSLFDLSLPEARDVFARTTAMKHAPVGSFRHLLAGDSIAVVLEKSSTRTRVSFEAGICHLGGHPIVLTSDGSQIARGEPVHDTARVLARMCRLIAYRTSTHQRLQNMALASVPVINALSDDGHPVQVLCDVYTVEECFHRSIEGMHVAFVGDCGSNMARSWVQAASLFDFHLHLAAPDGYFAPQFELDRAGAHVTLHRDPKAAIAGCDVINTDVWASMGQESEAQKRRLDFVGWTLDSNMLAGAKNEAIVLHCLPAHRGEEIADDVIEGPRSRVWQQAENRLHVQKGLMTFLLQLPV
jgi:ornithine carbamoyltransferase